MKPIIHKSFQKNFWQKLDLKNDVNDDVFSEKSIYLLKVLFYYEC